MTLARLSTSLADRYTIERELGQGGMATVYLAHDVRHDRKVALKVLRPELAAILGAERFLAEIKTTANLQHPHILSLFDSGEADGTVFYVMPFVEGESLRDRLNREKQLPVDDAVRITCEVADALDYAHRHGVVHRDIKPENILLHDGRALVADFGIALAVSRSDGGTRMTETGMSLGTPHYMAPEQAMGEREITPKADVYALGCVLYEMLSGEPPFNGPTAQAIIARVMTEQPRALTLQRHTIPPHVEAAAGRALEKLPADRFASAAQFAEALRHPGTVPVTMARPGAPRPAAPARRVAALTPWLLALAAVLLAGWGWMRARAASRQGAVWQRVSFGDSIVMSTAYPTLALSPDGEVLVFKDDVQNGRLWIKRRGELDATPIAGTERAQNPAFSPDGEWVVFLADGHLKKVRVVGGATVTLADSAANGGFGGAAWLDDNTVVYTSPSLLELLRVSAAGGPSNPVLHDTALGGLGAGTPTPLPGARGVLFEGCTSGCVTQAVYVLDLRTGKQKRLIDDAAEAWYLPTGHVLYVRRDGVGMVAPFDLGKLEITGPAVPVLERVFTTSGFSQLAVSAAGSLVYLRGTGGSTDNVFVRVARSGAVTPIDTTWFGQFNSLALSPDGRRLAVGAGSTGGGLNIWIKQLDRGPFTRLTFGGQDRRPAWSPDGRAVAFVRDSGNIGVVVVRPADGSGPDRLLARLDRRIQEVTWSHDGRWIVVRTDNGAAGAGDLVGLRTSGDATPVPLLSSGFTELHPALSPDGRWLAYTSNESGLNEVYVRPFPNTDGGRWQISNGGGSQARWAANGRELFFLDATFHLVAADVRAGATFAVAGTRSLFDASRLTVDNFHTSYEVSPDGRSFLIAATRQVGAARAPEIVQVDHWFADVRARLAK
jgi:serine/threonine-protein kinase